MQGTAQDSQPMNRLHKAHVEALKSEGLTKHSQILCG